MPSAPVPPPIRVVKVACRPLLATGTAYTADPAWLFTAWVSWSVVPDIRALPLSVHPPPGGGTAIPEAGAGPVPGTGVVRGLGPGTSPPVGRVGPHPRAVPGRGERNRVSRAK